MAIVVRALYCVPNFHVKQEEVFFECVRTYLFWPKKQVYIKALLKLFWASRKIYQVQDAK